MGIIDRLGEIREDLESAFGRDPAARSWPTLILCYPGLHALMLHRVAHRLWNSGLELPARALSNLSRFLTGIEIHPGAVIGRRLFIDHGSGVVIGETAEIGDDVVLYQGVTLGGVSLSRGKRHPTIGGGVVIGAGAKVLGPLEVGEGAVIGAGSVVVSGVPAGSVAAGVPARVISEAASGGARHALRHDRITDPLAGLIGSLERRIAELEEIVLRRGERRSDEAV